MSGRFGSNPSVAVFVLTNTVIDFKPIFALIIGIISLCLSIYFSVLSDTSETDMSESFLLFCGFLAVVIAAGFYVAHLGKGK